MRLPNSERAIVDVRKLKDYCLNPEHPRGRHKARVFLQALGIERRDAAWLQQRILASLPDSEAIELSTNAHGATWRADVPVARHEKMVVVL